jgi:hypothetical protein
MEINWLSYIIVIVITTFIVAIITENVVVDRLQMTECVYIMAGRCRLKPGYGKLGPASASMNIQQRNIYSDSLLEQEQMIENLQKDIQTLKDRLEQTEVNNQNQHSEGFRNQNHPYRPEGFRNQSEGFSNEFYRSL